LDVEIGRGKKARQGTGSWKLGPHLLELPLIGSAMDGVVSPATAI
jgi:hypothetical protein